MTDAKTPDHYPSLEVRMILAERLELAEGSPEAEDNPLRLRLHDARKRRLDERLERAQARDSRPVPAYPSGGEYKVNLYYVANFPDLRWDRECGFKDDPAPLKVIRDTEGIWVYDRPVIHDEIDEPLNFRTCVTVEAVADAVAEYEHTEPRESYRKWRVPAAILNRYPQSTEQYPPAKT